MEWRQVDEQLDLLEINTSDINNDNHEVFVDIPSSTSIFERRLGSSLQSQADWTWKQNQWPRQLEKAIWYLKKNSMSNVWNWTDTQSPIIQHFFEDFLLHIIVDTKIYLFGQSTLFWSIKSVILCEKHPHP